MLPPSPDHGVRVVVCKKKECTTHHERLEFAEMAIEVTTLNGGTHDNGVLFACILSPCVAATLVVHELRTSPQRRQVLDDKVVQEFGLLQQALETGPLLQPIFAPPFRRAEYTAPPCVPPLGIAISVEAAAI